MLEKKTSSYRAQKDLNHLWFSKKECKEICRYIDNHHKSDEILASPNPNKQRKKLRLLLSEWWEKRTRNLMNVVKSDRQWQFNPIQWHKYADIDYIENIIDQIIDEEWKFTQKDLCIDGNWIMETLHITSWPKVWELMKKTFDRVITDPNNRNNDISIKYFLKSYIGK